MGAESKSELGTMPLLVSLAALIGFLVAVIWGITGAGYFWPMWVWFGLAVPFGSYGAVRHALRAPPGRTRGIALHGALSGIVGAILVTIWALAGGGTFWPFIPIVSLGGLVAVHAVIAAALDRPSERALEDRVDELTRTRHGALAVQEAELRRIERDLHDGAQARLVALSMHLGRAEERLDDAPEVAYLLRQARGEAGAAIAELRDLARGIFPPVLADRGLGAAVEALASRSATPVTVEVDINRRLPPVVEAAAYYVVAEGLANAVKHADGNGADVTIVVGRRRMIVVVADDGKGGADPRGSGLTGLRHRVEALDGKLEVMSPPGRGTTIRAELPCGS
jgi:signal transduction histidine kinase